MWHTVRTKDKEEAFRSLLFRQVEIYREGNLLLEQEPWFLHSKGGAYLCFFAWKSKEVVESLETNPKVQQLWTQFEKICSFEKPSLGPELQEMFSDFASLNKQLL